jgi:two-component system invasion response regulator UvrY
MIRVVIAESHAIVRHRLEQLCRDTHDVAVVASAIGPEDLLHQVKVTRPDVAIISLSPHPALTFEVLRELKRSHPGIAAILLSLYHHDSYALCALEAGASGYLMMEHAQEQLLETIRMFVLGGPVASTPDGQFAAI